MVYNIIKFILFIFLTEILLSRIEFQFRKHLKKGFLHI